MTSLKGKVESGKITEYRVSLEVTRSEYYCRAQLIACPRLWADGQFSVCTRRTCGQGDNKPEIVFWCGRHATQ